MIRRAKFSELLAEVKLIQEYGAECSIPEIGPINPQADIYATMENSGMMQAFAAELSGKIVGFADILTPVLPHYGLKVGISESLFVSDRFRNSSIGGKLMHEVEGYARDSGGVGILYSAPAGGQLERVLHASKSYRHTNTVFYRKF